MRMKVQRDGFWVTIVQGDYGSDGRRAILREEAEGRGRHGRRKIHDIMFETGLTHGERQDLIDSWS